MSRPEAASLDVADDRGGEVTDQVRERLVVSDEHGPRPRIPAGDAIHAEERGSGMGGLVSDGSVRELPRPEAHDDDRSGVRPGPGDAGSDRHGSSEIRVGVEWVAPIPGVRANEL